MISILQIFDAREKNQLLLSMTNVIGKLLNLQAKRTQNEIAKKQRFLTGL
jgi:hypothetical protein